MGSLLARLGPSLLLALALSLTGPATASVQVIHLGQPDPPAEMVGNPDYSHYTQSISVEYYDPIEQCFGVSLCHNAAEPSMPVTVKSTLSGVSGLFGGFTSCTPAEPASGSHTMKVKFMIMSGLLDTGSPEAGPSWEPQFVEMTVDIHYTGLAFRRHGYTSAGSHPNQGAESISECVANESIPEPSPEIGYDVTTLIQSVSYDPMRSPGGQPVSECADLCNAQAKAYMIAVVPVYMEVEIYAPDIPLSDNFAFARATYMVHAGGTQHEHEIELDSRVPETMASPGWRTIPYTQSITVFVGPTDPILSQPCVPLEFVDPGAGTVTTYALANRPSVPHGGFGLLEAKATATIDYSSIVYSISFH